MKHLKLLALSLSVVAQGASYYDPMDTYLNGSPARSELTWERVEKAFHQNSAPQSVEDFLNWVREVTPYQLKHFTLVHRSRSQQEASYSSPRAIVFGPDARFIFTFNGHPQQAGYNAIEVIHFDDSKKKFEFREITFTEKGPELSQANPNKCMQCHGTTLKPIWAAYDIWDGVYGTEDDAILDFTEKYPPAKKSQEIAEEHTRQLKEFRNLKKGWSAHSRYSILNPPEGSPLSPYNTRIRSDYRFRPNLALTDRLSRLQAEKLATELSAPSSCRDTYREFLTAVLLGCGEIGAFSNQIEYQELLGIVENQHQKKFPQKSLGNWDHLNGEDYRPERAILLSLMDVERDDWHLDLNPNTWSFFEGASQLADLVGEKLYEKLDSSGAVSYSELIKFRRGEYLGDSYYEEESYDTGEPTPKKIHSPMPQLCEDLVAKASPKIRKHPTACQMIQKPEGSSLEEPISAKICGSCHYQGSELPEIAFNSQWKFLIETLVRSGTMPPVRPLNGREQIQLLNFLRSKTE